MSKIKKFSEKDQRFFKKRKELEKKWKRPVDMWRLTDNWPLYAGWVNIGRFLAISDLLRQVIDLPGHVVEFGTWNGTNLMWLAKLVKLLKPHSLTEIYGFDSFEGLQQILDEDHLPKELKGKYAGNEQVLKDLIKLYEFDDFVHLVKGNIELTLPKFLKQRPEVMFSFVYCDTDLFSSTKLILELLEERVLTGGIIVFDEFNIQNYPGESLAVREVLKDKYELKSVSWTRQPTAYLVKK